MSNESFYTPKQLSKLLRVSPQALKNWENNGKIRAVRTNGGHRRYIIPTTSQLYTDTQQPRKQFIYARVSSSKQKGDLERQIASLQKAYPSFDVIKDIGSGINFKRRGLTSLLEQVFNGNVSQVVVSHKDRLTRFGFELFELIFRRFGVVLTVLSAPRVKEPASELATDLLSIITVFTARFYGSRKYKVLPKNKVLSVRRASALSKKVHRGNKVLLQQGGSLPQDPRVERITEIRETKTFGDEQ